MQMGSRCLSYDLVYKVERAYVIVSSTTEGSEGEVDGGVRGERGTEH